MTMYDEQARKTALDPRGSFIVQAPAGSGKTELLTQRILSLLATAALQPEEVLAITFTRKAADEMRLRVLDSLVLGKETEPESPHKRRTWELARQVLAQDEKHEWNLSNNPQRLQIMTIDAFCAGIAKQMPVLSRMGAVLNIAEHPSLLYQEAARRTITNLLAQNDNSIQTLLLHLDNQQNRALTEIANMLQYREQWLGLILHQQHDDVREFLEANLAQVVERNLTEAASVFPLKLWYDLKPLLKFALNHINAPELEACLQWERPEDNLETLPNWKALIHWLLTQAGTVKKSPDKRMGFPSGKDETLKVMKADMKGWLARLQGQPDLVGYLQQLRALPEPEYHEQQWEVLQALFKILPIASAELFLQFQEQGAVDFSAIAQSALQALGGQEDPTDLTLKLDNKISHILVDEFQDTSILQFQLLEKLLAGWQANDGRTLFLVGDPMQSIYRFRQAQVGLFLQAQEAGVGPVKLTPLRLEMNFRSQGSFIEWLNHHAPQCFASASDSALGAITYAPSKTIDETNRKNSVHTYASRAPEQQAQQVIVTLKKLQNDATINSVAVLVRARTHLFEITQALNEHQLPYQAIDLEPLANTPVVQHLLALTRAYQSLSDSIAWLAVLRGPFCGLSLEDITHLREKSLDKTVYENCLEAQSISEEGENILERVVPLFKHAILQKQRMPLSHSIKDLWLRLGGPAHAQEAQALQDAEAFFDLLQDEENFEERLNFAFSKPAHSDTKIQVMTIHRAKGLEFDAVLIPGIERRAPISDKPLLLWDNLPELLFAPIHSTQGELEPIYEYLWQVQKQKGSYELGRLLYVALTRTKNQLHLFACLEDEDKAPIAGSLLSLLWGTMQDAFIESLEEVPVKAHKSKAQLTRLDPAWRWPENLQAPLLVTSLDTSRGNHVPIEQCSLQRLREKAIGTVLHSALYHQTEDPQRWRAHLLELGVCNELDAALNTIQDGLAKTKADGKGQWILSQQQNAHAEYAILARHDNEIARIIIDKTFVDEQGVRWIVDYKTSTPGSMPVEQFYQQAQAQHAPQLERYAAILAQQETRPIKLGLYFPLFAGWHEWEL